MSGFQPEATESVFGTDGYGISSDGDNEQLWFREFAHEDNPQAEPSPASFFGPGETWSHAPVSSNIDGLSVDQGVAWTGEIPVSIDVLTPDGLEQAARLDRFDRLDLAPADEAPWNGSHGKSARNVLSVPVDQGNLLEGVGLDIDPPASCSIGYPMVPSSDSGYRSSHRRNWDVKSCELTKSNSSPSNFHQYKIVKRPRSSPIAELSSLSKRSRVTQKTNSIRCPECNKPLKNKSEEKKHEAQHTKPFRCKELSCTRKEGFGTKNDLERHRQSVHKMLPEMGSDFGYICSLCKLPDSGEAKVWPRKDNFTSHIRRKHPQAKEEIVLQRSKRTVRLGSTISESDYMSVEKPNPMELHDESIRQGYYIATSMQNQASQSSHTTVFGPDKLTEGDNLAGQGTWAEQKNDIWTSLMGETHCTKTSSIMSRVQRANPQVCGSQLNLSAQNLGGKSSNARSLSTMSFPTAELENLQVLDRPRSAITTDRGVYVDKPGQTHLNSFDQAQNIRTESGLWICSDCGFNRKRRCEIRKHRKRHTRPYGCTFQHCFKRFGSRNDWKRHESAQHWWPEMWRCELDGVGAAKCSFVAYKKDHFAEHLSGKHYISSEDPEHSRKMRQSHLGQFANVNFWCGFCNKLIKQVESDVEKYGSTSMRFKHVGDHLDSGRDIGEWVCVELNKPYKTMSGFRGRNTGGGYKGSDDHEGEEDDEDSDLGSDGIE